MDNQKRNITLSNLAFQRFRSIFSFDWLIKNNCLLCRAITVSRYHYFCQYCYLDLVLLPKGVNLLTDIPNTKDKLLCRYLSGISVITSYHYPYNHLITQYKFNNKQELAKLFGRQLTSHLLQAEWLNVNGICHLPVSTKRKQQRGFDQAELLAKCVAQQLNVPIINPLKRIKHTKAQTTLNKHQRHLNIKNAFTITEDVSKLRLLLIDDVITTGATANEAAKVLLEKGATAVYFAAVAISELNN